MSLEQTYLRPENSLVDISSQHCWGRQHWRVRWRHHCSTDSAQAEKRHPSRGQILEAQRQNQIGVRPAIFSWNQSDPDCEVSQSLRPKMTTNTSQVLGSIYLEFLHTLCFPNLWPWQWCRRAQRELSSSVKWGHLHKTASLPLWMFWRTGPFGSSIAMESLPMLVRKCSLSKVPLCNPEWCLSSHWHQDQGCPRAHWWWQKAGPKTNFKRIIRIAKVTQFESLVLFCPFLCCFSTY